MKITVEINYTPGPINFSILTDKDIDELTFTGLILASYSLLPCTVECMPLKDRKENSVKTKIIVEPGKVTYDKKILSSLEVRGFLHRVLQDIERKKAKGQLREMLQKASIIKPPQVNMPGIRA